MWAEPREGIVSIGVEPLGLWTVASLHGGWELLCQEPMLPGDMRAYFWASDTSSYLRTWLQTIRTTFAAYHGAELRETSVLLSLKQNPLFESSLWPPHQSRKEVTIHLFLWAIWDKGQRDRQTRARLCVHLSTQRREG